MVVNCECVCVFRCVCTVRTQRPHPLKRTCPTWTWASWGRSWAEELRANQRSQSLSQSQALELYMRKDTQIQTWTHTHTHILDVCLIILTAQCCHGDAREDERWLQG